MRVASTSGFRELDREKLTPFARMLYDYMLSFSPTMLVFELARETGIANNTIWSWLKYDIIPRRSTIIALAQRTTGLDVDELLRAAGLPDTSQSDAERRLQMRVYRVMLKRLEQSMERDPHLTPEMRAQFLAYLRSHAGLIAAGIEPAEVGAEAEEGAPETPKAPKTSTSDEHRARRKVPASARR